MRKSVTIPSPEGELRASLSLPEGRDLPALIVCHGAGEYRDNYNELCDYLAARGIASLALDLYGHGESAGVRHAIDIPIWVSDIELACDYLESIPQIGRGKLAAFGLSSGGTAILEAAIAEPRLRALIALDATARNPLDLRGSLLFGSLTAAGWIKRLFTGTDLRVPLNRWLGFDVPVSDPEIRARLLVEPRMLESGNAYPFPAGSPSFFVSTIRRVHRITVPTLVLWGAEDKVDSPESGRLIYEALGCEKELKVIEGNGHMGHVDRNRMAVFEATAGWILRHL
jgi:alpha-beta hydrolase superfamily lysophospholipase